MCDPIACVCAASSVRDIAALRDSNRQPCLRGQGNQRIQAEQGYLSRTGRKTRARDAEFPCRGFAVTFHDSTRARSALESVRAGKVAGR